MKYFVSFLFVSLYVATVANAATDEVALVIGGIKYCYRDDSTTCQPDPNKFWQGDMSNPDNIFGVRSECAEIDPNTAAFLSTTELLGCPEGLADFTMPDYPEGIAFAYGVWHEGEQKVLSCGGIKCFNSLEYGDATNKCFWWDPFGSREWEEAPPMNEERTAFFMGKITMNNERYPIAIGGYPSNITTEYFANNKWNRHTDLPANFNPFDNVAGCLVQNDNSIYSIKLNNMRLDMGDWKVTELAEPPFTGKRSGMCATTTRHTDRGIMSKMGNFYNIRLNEWQKVLEPPVPWLAELYSMTDFRGDATVFGLPECKDDLSECRTGKGVYAYNDGHNNWYKIAEMKDARIFSQVINMPRSICQGFVSTTTTDKPPSTASSSTTDSTGAPTTSGAVSLTLNVSLAFIVAFVAKF